METFGLLATFMNHDGAWITGREERGEDTQITTSCSGSRTLLSREKRHDYFKHSLPSGLWERKETLSSSCWMSLIFSSPRQIFKTHKIIPVDSLRVFTGDTGSHVVSVWALTSPFPQLRWPRHILASDHLCPVQLPSNEIITMFVQCRPNQ